ncbi:hypothetical protein [Sulfuriferula nivalis]|uniref:Uncharacterized protein n=1 Tax=Sulfuriferula nivalis TaxID=2675298 RepID=A0A809RLQ6_9PROT|nr:hypothetical protein [Sulfuriferula nivalis]BBP01734.1 hypothetical protein SFSGTM_24420 [Sulfuriferula nivalis]
MNTARNLVTATIIAAGLLVFSEANAQLLRSDELVCSGIVTYGKNTFSDQIVLRFSNNDVAVSGEAGMTSTFEGLLRYKICSESENEADFEYTTSNKCGSKATRSGHLSKVVGSLRLTRSDRGEPFIGEYKCKPAQRVLK